MGKPEYEDGVFHLQAESQEEFDQMRDELAAQVGALASEQRARLDAQGIAPWWADAVFLIRDIKGICGLLQIRGMEDVAEILATISAKSTMALLERVFDGDVEKARQAAKDIIQEGDVLDAILSRQIGGKDAANPVQ